GLRLDHSLVHDASRHRLVLVGGAANGTTYILDGGKWVPGPTEGKVLTGGAATYDASRRVIVHVGMYMGGLHTLELFDTTWIESPPSTVLPARFEPALGFDGRRQRVVMWGGRNAAQGST